jgi:hypothetical protein
MYSSTFWFIHSVALSVFRWYAVNILHTIFKVDRLSFITAHKLSASIWDYCDKKLMSSVEMLYECLSHSFCSHILACFSIILLLKQSVIIRRFVQPSLDSRSTTKSMNIFVKSASIQVKASRSLVSDLFSCCSYTFVNFSRMYRHSVAFQIKRTVMIREHQLHFFWVFSHCWVMCILNQFCTKRFWVDTQCLSWKSNFSSLLRSILLWILSL